MKNTDQDLLKVMKLNKDISKNALENARRLNKEWYCDNKKEKDKLSTLDELFNIDSSRIDSSERYKYKSEIKDNSDFEIIVKEANKLYPEDVPFEDILSEEQISHALNHTKEIENEFKKATKLSKRDNKILIIAIALQCVRQYILDPWLRSIRSDSSIDDEKGEKKYADKGWYYVPTNNILINRVPFDAQRINHANSTVEGFLKGAKDHRYVTLGHDPMLGWIFGTANILTSTITRYDFKSAHVKYNSESGNKQNNIHSLADNKKIKDAIKDRWICEDDGKLAVGLALLREAKHLLSDVNTKDSLPIPILMRYSPKYAEKLVSYGIDTAGVTVGAGISGVINMLIAMVHQLFNDGETDDELYQVRTRKIILYSNVIASTSNIIVAKISKKMELLDVGGLLVTISRLFGDVNFILEVKQEFINDRLNKEFEGSREEIIKLYNERFS